jgi:hypothetical protein
MIKESLEVTSPYGGELMKVIAGTFRILTADCCVTRVWERLAMYQEAVHMRGPSSHVPLRNG